VERKSGRSDQSEIDGQTRGDQTQDGFGVKKTESAADFLSFLVTDMTTECCREFIENWGGVVIRVLVKFV